MEQDLARVRELFDEIIQAAPEDRSALLAARCNSDGALRKRVEALIATAESDDPFLSQPTRSDAFMATVAAAPLSERPGTRIGPYKLLQQIGEGGFGVVFMAEQDQPVRRRVALKVIKLGMDTRQVVARFEQERQALALMDHPNIAKVLDAGATESGRPYFVMEYVKGDPITEFADAHKLSVPDRLQLFAQVCAAVQHAHTKGVVHRDLKPRNVLVCMSDGRPFAKVIDFGIAKATGARLTEKTLFTEHRQLIGTPEYMSPEQAEGSPDIDTRTDVYSLGVLLYELLTGATPFDAERLRSAAYAELQRIIKEEDPPAPSLRLSRDLRALAAAATARGAEPGRLGTLIRGELDWIVMKALDKDRARRYESPSQLAGDVQRHLSGEPVTAAPPSTMYRVRKFARRHRGRVVAAGTVAAVLVLGTASTSVGFALEARQRQAAEQAAETAVAARDAEARARAEAENQRRAAEQNAYVANLLAAASDPQSARQRLDACPVHLRGWEWHYLADRSDTSQHVLDDGAAPVYKAAFSPDGTRIATAYRGGRQEARVWDAATGRLLASLPAAGGSNALAFSPDGEQLLVCGLGRAVVWSIHEPRALLTLPVAPSASPRGVFSPDGARILTWEWNQSPQVWDARTGALINTIPLQGNGDKGTESLCDATFSANGAHVITGHSDHANIWDVATGALLRTLPCQDEQARTIEVSPDGRWIMGFGFSSEVPVWNARTGDIQARLTVKGDRGLVEAAFSRDGSLIVTSGYGRGVQVWDAATGALVRDLTVERPGGWHAALFSPDATRLLVWGVGTPAVFEIATGDRRFDLVGHEADVLDADFSHDGSMIVTASDDGTARLWEARSPSNPRILRAHDHPVTDLQFSADGQQLLSAASNQWRLWNPETRLPGAAFTDPHATPWSYGRRVAFLPDGRLLSWIRAAEVFDPAGRAAPLTIVPRSKATRDDEEAQSSDPILGASTGGTRVLITTRDRVRIADAGTGTIVQQTDIPGCEYAELSPDGSRVLAVIFEESVVRVLDAATGQALFELPGQLARFDPTGTRILTLSRNNRGARLWDARTGQPVSVLDLPPDQWAHNQVTQWTVWGMLRPRVDVPTFSPDGTRVVLPADDWEWPSARPAYIYEVSTGRRLAELRADLGWNSCIAFSPDGQRIATCRWSDPDGSSIRDAGIRLWDADSGSQLLQLPVPSEDGYGITALAWSPGGTRLAAGGNDGQVTIFSAPVLAEAREQP